MTAEDQKKRLTCWLAGVFILALVMGPGPGVYLVNPSADDAAPRTVFGAPVLYAWAVFWFLVMALTVIVAYKKLWSAAEEVS